MAEYGFGIDMPLAPSDEASDFGLRLNMTDLAMNDAIWMMADPSGALPHDPATLLIDLSGKARLLLDLMNTQQAMETGEVGLPAALTALPPHDLALQLCRADLAHQGSFTFAHPHLAPTGPPRTHAHLNRLNRAAPMARYQGTAMELWTPGEAKEPHPFLETHDLAGVLDDPTDGDIDPAQLTQALAKGARDMGQKILRFCPATGVTQQADKSWIVHTEKGDIAADYVVNAAGYYAQPVGQVF